MNSLKISSNRFKELDALRGIAALLVVFFHFTWGRPDSQFNFNIGNMGVELFFIISGFVIFMSLSKIKQGSEFIISRFCRLYPTYWASLSLTFLLITIYYHYTIIDYPKLLFTDYLINLSMFQFFFSVPNVDESYWTLTIELLFYLLMFILFKFKLLARIQWIGLALCVLLVILAQFFWNTPVQWLFKWIPLCTYFPLFLAGILFYKLSSTEKKHAFTYLSIVLCFVFQALLFKTSGRAIFFSASAYVMMLGIFMLLFMGVSSKRFQFIAIRPLLFVGKISFALYLIHTFISINLLFPLLLDTWHFNYWLSSLFIVLPVLIGIAAFITFYIEIPLQAKLKSKLTKFMQQVQSF